MNYDELRTEAQEAMDYWQKVISFRDFKKQIPDMEQFVANVLEKQGVEMVTGEEE